MSAPKAPIFSTLAGFILDAFFSIVVSALMVGIAFGPTDWRWFSVFAYPVRASALTVAAILLGRAPVALFRLLLSLFGRDDIDAERYRRTYGRAGWAAAWIFSGLVIASSLWAVVRTPGLPVWAYIFYGAVYLLFLFGIIVGWLSTVANVRF